MRSLLVFVCVALWAAAPLAAQQQEQRVVRRLSFQGNRAIDDYTLSTAIATSNSSFFARVWWLRWTHLGERRFFNETEFRRDALRLLLLYHQSGYVNAVIDTVVTRKPRDAFITFRIHEGEPVRLVRLSIIGIDSVLNVKNLKKDVLLQVGQPFNRFLLQASADTIRERLRNVGYPYATVLRNFDEDDGALTAAATLEAVPGRRMTVGEVAIEGLAQVDSSTVRHMLTVRPNDLFVQNRLYQSQRDLYDIGVFRAVNVFLADSLPPAAPADTSVRVVVHLAEGAMHRVLTGVGYGTIDCFRGQAGWTAFNLFGGARSLDLTGNVSKLGVGRPTDLGFADNVCGSLKNDATSDTLNYNVSLTLRQLTFFSPRNAARLSLFVERRSEFQAYTRQDVGVNPAIIINARRDIPVTLGYTFTVGRTTADPAVFCRELRICDSSDQAALSAYHRFAALTLTGVRNHVNSVLDPSRGSSVTMGLMYASRLVGSDSLYEFNRGELNAARYFPLGRRGTFAVRVQAGTILPANLVTLAGQGVRFVPPDQRFYGGGPSSVRGYARNELGPRVYVIDTIVGTDSTILTEPTGGNSIVVFNAEVRFATPLFPDRMRVAVFTDVGQVWERAESGNVSGLRITPGVGLRFVTPLGPVRIDAAYNGYAPEPGQLYIRTAKTLTLVPNLLYAPPRPPTFLKRVVVQFAVGQAF